MQTKTTRKTEELFLPGFEFTGKRPAHHDEKWRKFLKSIGRHQERLMSMAVTGESAWHILKRIEKRYGADIDKKSKGTDNKAE